MAKRKWSEQEIEKYRRTHNSYFIYYNKEDANLFVPRADPFWMRSITGVTFNWAHPIAKIFLLVVLAFILIPVFFNIKYGI